jgi:hypothetical protein
MKHHGVTRLWLPLLAAMVGTVAGCGAGDGSTTCGDYVDMSGGNQQETVENMLSATGQDTSNGNLMLTMGSVRLYCMVHPDDSRIDGIYRG